MDKKWWTLLAVCTGTFMLLLDVTIVIVAQPAIQSRAARELQRCAVGPRRLCADPGLAAADLGRAGRPVRAQAAVRHRAGHLHPRVAAVRRGPGPADADRVPERPGRRRGDHVRHLAGPAREQLPGPGPGRGVRGLGGDHRRVHGARPGARRRDHHELELARHLPGQRADRRPGRGADGLAGRASPSRLIPRPRTGPGSRCSRPVW